MRLVDNFDCHPDCRILEIQRVYSDKVVDMIVGPERICVNFIM